MTAQESPPPIALFRMITGFYVSRAIHVAAQLGIADLLSQGPVHHEALARDTATHASLNRMLRLLVGAGVLMEQEGGRFALTPVGDCLRAEGPGSMHAAALLFGGITQEAWSELRYSVENGEPAFRRVFGTDTFSYLTQHPDEAANFDAAMADFTRMIAVAVAATYEFSGAGTVMDAGAGNGVLLEAVLRANPALRGVLFDLPHVAERARGRIRDAGLADRCGLVGGDFFAAVPEGADACMLKHVIHDWNDNNAAAILRNCHRAMGPEGKLLVVESVYPQTVDQSDIAFAAAANDVNNLVCTGGRQRSDQELRELYQTAGFRLARIVPTAARVWMIEGVKA
jgi:SAM-dependent methyltransferase